MKRLLFTLPIILLAFTLYSQDTPSLTYEQLDAVKTLKDNGVISYYSGSERIVRIDPDYWVAMNFQQRKTFTVMICVYVNRYVLKSYSMKDWWVRIENMATNKKLAKWDNLSHYKEF